MKTGGCTKKLFACCCIAASMYVSSANAQTINTFAGDGTGAGQFFGGFSGDGGPAIDAEFLWPSFVTIDKKGNVYIADQFNNRIRKVDTSGTINTIAGNGDGVYAGDGGPATSASLYYPNSLVVDDTGNIYIADTYNNVVRKIDTSGNITTIVGTGTSGYTGDGGAATAAELNQPYYVAFDAAGNLYIADNGNHVIRKVDGTGTISTVVGTGVSGYNGDNIAADTAQLGSPFQIAFDPAGNMIIADYSGNRIRKVDASGIITTIAGDGTPNFGGNGGLATAAQIHGPTGVAYDASGNLYITDQGDNEIRVVNTSGIINDIAGSGTPGYSGDGGAALYADMFAPSNVVFDATGNMYISDYLNNVIRIVALCGHPATETIAVSADTTSFCGSTGSLTFTLNGADSGNANINYAWETSTDGVNYTSAGSDTTILSVNNLTNTTYYKINVTCAVSGVTDSITDTITVNPTVAPTVTVTADPGTSISPNESVTFTATVINGGANPTYQWEQNGSPINGATNSTYTTSMLANNDVITCLVHSNSPCASSDTVTSSPLTILVNSGIATLNSGSNYIRIYPNPNNGTFRLEGIINDNKKADIEVLNVLGQVVYQQAAPIQSNHLSTQVSLPDETTNGVYEVRIHTDNNTTVQRIVIAK